MSSRPAGNAAFVFIFIAVLVDSIGFGIILPVLPRLIMELTGVTVDRAAAYGAASAINAGPAEIDRASVQTHPLTTMEAA